MAKINFALFLKGVAMGAADIVPGVSGGTVAFITGIYEQLLNALKNISPKALLILKDDGIAAFWRHVDGTFLLTLMIGILASALTLVRGISYLLTEYPHLLWAFFFGLILVSSWIVSKQIDKWSTGTSTMLIVGTLVAFTITELSPAELDPVLPLVFFSGLIAICAMILPGISGSFILLLLGMYGHVIDAIKGFDLVFIAVFGVGCVTGLLSFSHLLSWLFNNYRSLVLALLTGFLLGSLNKVWPWKETVSTRVNSHGEEVPFMQANVLPAQFEKVSQQDPQLILCILLAVIGVVLVWALESQFNTSSSE